MNWTFKKLGEVMEIARGGSPRPIKKYLTDSEDGLNWIKISDATASSKYIYETKQKITKEGLHKTRLVEEGDFLLSNSMSFGRPYIMKTKGCIHDGWLVLKEKEKGLLDKDYLFHLLGSPYIFKEFDRLAAGSTVRNLNIALVSSVQIPIPPLPEQKQIVAILDKAFAAIDQAQANIEKNIENAKELFENWTFQTIKNANWNTINWGEVCDFTRGPFGGSLKKSMFVESGYAVYEQKQAIHNDYDALRYFVDEEKFQEMKRFEVKPADLLMSCSGVTLGRISEVPEDAPKGIINQALLKLTAKPDKVLNDFLIIWIRSKIFQDLIFKVAGGAAQPNVPGVKILKNIKLPCPTITEQEDFIELHDSMKEFTQNSITANIRKNESLEELKKSILQRAFSGELIQKSVTV